MTLSAKAEDRMRELWDAGISVADIADALGVTPSTVYKLSVTYRLPPRARGGRDPIDPSEEEIYATAAAIRATWSHERLAESRSGGWVPPRV